MSKKSTAAYVFNEFRGGHSRHDEEIADDDPEILWPTHAERGPQLLHFLGVLVTKLWRKRRDQFKGKQTPFKLGNNLP